METKFKRVQEEIETLKWHLKDDSLSESGKEKLKELETLMDYVQSSLQLNGKHKTNFEVWVKENCKSLGSGIYLYKDRKCSYEALKIDYRHELEENL